MMGENPFFKYFSECWVADLHLCHDSHWSDQLLIHTLVGSLIDSYWLNQMLIHVGQIRC